MAEHSGTQLMSSRMRPALVDADAPMVGPGGHLDTSPVGGPSWDHPAKRLQDPDPQRQTGLRPSRFG